MRRHLTLIALALLVPTGASAEGFGTPVIDGILDVAIYGAAEATDPEDAPFGGAEFDLGDALHVANDNNFWYFYFEVFEDLSIHQGAKYILFIDTTNDTDGGNTTGGTDDAWGRSISVLDPHKPEYTVRSWIDGGGSYSAAKTQLWVWDQVGGTWSSPGPITEAALSAGTQSGIEWKISRAALGDPATIWCEVATTGGSDPDNAQDTINNSVWPDEWNATDWTTTAVLRNSTDVAIATGSDTTPPTVIGGCALDINDGITDTVQLVFSEPVDPTTVPTATYTDLSGRFVSAPVLVDPTTVEVLVTPVYGFGTCEQIRVAGIDDLAGNPIVDNGTTNVVNFYGFQIHMRGQMSLHMQAHDVPPHTFAIEGSVSPLTWDPTCDFVLTDGDADSVYTGDITFCLPCSTGGSGPQPTPLEYKFTHQCTEWENLAGGGNHFYLIDPTLAVRGAPNGIDTLNIWWADEAPQDFTTVDIDVIFTVQAKAGDPPLVAADSLNLNGEEAPLNWNIPPETPMLDDGVPPDALAGDGIWSRRITFPAGSKKDAAFKYIAKRVGETEFLYECPGFGNRSVFLDDTIYSTANPIILPLAAYDICVNGPVVGVESPLVVTGIVLEPSRPNPSHGTAEISYNVRHRSAVRLEIYDVSGRLVRTLVDEVRPEGRHTVVWNGRRADGALLPTGVYFSRISVGDQMATEKMVLIR